MSGQRARVVLLEGHRKRDFYANVVAALEASFDEASPAELLHGPADGVDLVVVDDETWPYTAAAICACRRAGVPTLHLVDGILEWTNTWDNPRQATEADGMPLFQPVLSDKIACMGASQARLLESWGNPGKCEVTGSPRLDGIAMTPPAGRPDGSIEVLVATARAPAFTAGQRDRVVSSLRDLRDWFAAGPVCDGHPVRPAWRLTDGLDDEIGVANATATSLEQQLSRVHAVVTTPSTVQVEAMLAGRPVALLDYLNRPHFVPAAWTISAPGQVAETMRLLALPEPHRLQYQQAILDDTVACRGAAGARVGELAELMIAAGRRCRSEGRQLELPARLLPTPQDDQTPDARRFRPTDLHPGHPIFHDHDVAALQTEVAQLRRAMQLSPWQRLYRFATRTQRRLGRGGDPS